MICRYRFIALRLNLLPPGSAFCHVSGIPALQAFLKQLSQSLLFLLRQRRHQLLVRLCGVLSRAVMKEMPALPDGKYSCLIHIHFCNIQICHNTISPFRPAINNINFNPYRIPSPLQKAIVLLQNDILSGTQPGTLPLHPGRPLKIYCPWPQNLFRRGKYGAPL